jgi:hypothetical protein
MSNSNRVNLTLTREQCRGHIQVRLHVGPETSQTAETHTLTLNVRQIYEEPECSTSLKSDQFLGYKIQFTITLREPALPTIPRRDSA